MAADEIAIKVDSVSKDFVLPHLRPNSVKSIFMSIYNRDSSVKNENQHALKNISFEVKKGEFFGIVGRNGSGKSTLLKILSGIYQPTKGKVTTQGRLVPFIELGVGFNPELTGRENVYLNGAMLGFDTKQIDAMYEDIVKFADLERFMDQKLKNYSSGMQVRLAFSMATRADADILLVDEVLAVGDADFQRKCFDYFKSLKENKKTVVFVSHDMNAVREYCDRAVLIEKSELREIGNTGVVTEKYSQLFLNEQLEEEEARGIQREGEGTVTVESVKVSKKQLKASDETLRIDVKLKANAKYKHLVTGFRVNSSSGQTLHETNTWNEQTYLPEVAPGGTCNITWEMPNIYSDGKYTIDVYVYGANNVLYDSLVEATSFRSVRPMHIGFLTSPQVKISVKD